MQFSLRHILLLTVLVAAACWCFAIYIPGVRMQRQIQNLVDVIHNTALPSHDVARAYAFDELEQLGTAAVPALIELLRDRVAANRELAAKILGGMGSAQADVLTTLEQALDDPDPDVRHAAREAIARLRSPEVGSPMDH